MAEAGFGRPRTKEFAHLATRFPHTGRAPVPRNQDVSFLLLPCALAQTEETQQVMRSSVRHRQTPLGHRRFEGFYGLGFEASFFPLTLQRSKLAPRLHGVPKELQVNALGLRPALLQPGRHGRGQGQIRVASCWRFKPSFFGRSCTVFKMFVRSFSYRA